MTEVTLVPVMGAVPHGGTLLGQPKGLFVLFMTEIWERFSFYGMRALLVLYMVQELLLPGNIEQVTGMVGFRSLLEYILGPMSTQAFASQIFGLYAGMVYLTPIIGGWLADRFFGTRKVVLAGITLMVAGHFAMAFEWSVLIALTLLVLGSGCLKGNIAAQVGEIYPNDDEAGRAQGFTIFSTGVNIGATLGPLACGTLAQIYGWDVGFGAAGVMMLFSGAAYLAGQKHLAQERQPRHDAKVAAPLTGDQWRMIFIVVIVVTIGIFYSLSYDQLFNVGIIWFDQYVDLATPFGAFPAAWFASVDSFVSTLAVPFIIAYWRWQVKRGNETADLYKIAIGSLLIGVSCAILAAGAWSVQAGGTKVTIWYPLVALGLTGVSFMWYWPITLAFVSRHSPPQVNALMMAGAYLVAFFSGIGSGFIGRYYEPLGPTNFWLLNAGFGIAGALCVLLFGPALHRWVTQLETRTSTIQSAHNKRSKLTPKATRSRM